MASIEAMRWLVLAVLLTPLLFAVVTALSGHAARRVAKVLALVHIGLAVTLVVNTVPALWARAEVPSERTGFHPLFVPGDPSETGETAWNVFPVGPDSAVQFYLGVDGLNVWLVLLASLLNYFAVLAAWRGVREKQAGFLAWAFALQAFVTGAFLSFDCILFYVFFELTLVPAFFLIGAWGTGGYKREAARRFFLYTFLGSLLTLTGFIGVAVMNPTPLAPDGKTVQRTIVEEKGFASIPQAGPVTFNVNRLMRNISAWSRLHDAKVAFFTRKLEAAQALHDRAKLQRGAADRELDQANETLAKAVAEREQYKTISFWLFFAVVAGFAVKTPIVPFHTWLPAAYSEAPPAATILLTGVLSKLGALGLLRFALTLCPNEVAQYGMPVFGFLGAVGVVYAAFCAFAQRDLRLLAAYSSVSHLGLLVLGLFAGNVEGISGAALHMVNHGLTAGAMFALLTFLSDRFHTTDTTQFSGLIGRFPLYATFMFVICLANVGLPGLNNFVGEMLMIAALFAPEATSSVGYWLAAAAGFGVFLSAWYTMTMLRRVFFGPVALPPADHEPRDCSHREVLAYGLPCVLCLLLGLFPQPVLRSIQSDAGVVVKQLDEARSRMGLPTAAARH